MKTALLISTLIFSSFAIAGESYKLIECKTGKTEFFETRAELHRSIDATTKEFVDTLTVSEDSIDLTLI